MTEHTVRPGETVVVSERRHIVGSKHRTDPHGRHLGFALEEGTPTILPTEVAADVTDGTKFAGTVAIAEGATKGALPIILRPEDQAARNAFLERSREVSPQGKVNALMDEGIRPLSLAGSAMQLIVAGVYDRKDAVEWARGQLKVAVLSGSSLREPWIAEARKLIEKKES